MYRKSLLKKITLSIIPFIVIFFTIIISFFIYKGVEIRQTKKYNLQSNLEDTYLKKESLGVFDTSIEESTKVLQTLEDSNLMPISKNVLFEYQIIEDKNNMEINKLKYEIEMYKKQQLEKQKVINAKRNEYINNNLKKIGIYNNPRYAVIYYNLKDNYLYSQNQDKLYVAASTIKVPYAMYFNELANEKLIDPKKEMYTYKSGDYEGGGGNFTKKIERGQIKLGDKVPVSELIEDMIENSDNSARRTLCSNRTEARAQIHKYFSKGGYVMNGNLVKPKDMLEIVKRLHNNPLTYNQTIWHMKKAEDYWKIGPQDILYAKKYGSYKSSASQIGIVYDKKPYILVIYSSETNQPKLQQIGKIIHSANQIN